jgi:hypothetical protein
MKYSVVEPPHFQQRLLANRRIQHEVDSIPDNHTLPKNYTGKDLYVAQSSQVFIAQRQNHLPVIRHDPRSKS